MGIRPHLTTIIGVDNLQVGGRDILDERAKKFASFYGTEEFNDLLHKEIPHYTDEWLKDFQCVRFDKHGEPCKLNYWEVFVWQPEYGLPNVIGCVPPNHYEGMKLPSMSILYVLSNAGIFGEEPFYKVVPPVSEEVYQWLSVRQGSLKVRQQYDYFREGSLDSDFILSQRILADLGFQFKIDELQLILYWYWC